MLSIAGTDPTGGAGLHADLKSIAANGGYGMAVATALVAQNTQGVRSIHQPPVAFLDEQLRAVSDDVVIDAVKIGMLFSAEVVGTVEAWLRRVHPPIVVLDPVMVAASGHRLLGDDAIDAVRALLPLVDLITPNAPELAALVDESPAPTTATLRAQAVRLAATTGSRILAKGGHLDGDESVDVLAEPDGASTQEFRARRIPTENTHGTGCSLSSALATLAARGLDWPAAVAESKRWLTGAIAAADALDVGHGHGPVSHFAELWARAGSASVDGD